MEDSYRHRGMRRSLVKTLRAKGINSEAVLEAIGKVPRHFFFDNALLEHAYQDKAFPIGEGQTISQPFTVAFQSEKLNVASGDKVLEIGTGSGYQACVLMELGANVYTIEYNKVLYERTRNFLPKMGYKPRFFQGDGSKGLPRHAPFDKIIVTAGAPSVPESLIRQLNIGGVLIIPVGDNEKQKMLRLTKIDEKKIRKEEFDYFSFVPLKGEEGWGR
ncbi:Protein-L-isoaspartate O-methyltransferase [Fulvivirga imtechensis AK7]|uniref:Protein-L-isoaspartate O-methyltransferase n=1 Tax=Fulvivirga imtechensis AK7 TaxID=1237149 RepID=L8JGW4_9BACT|nr:protein-L-isoaspartate(D-aspartate) O-methyltransferase [Fulvivirga imtechensis]ELR68065.1 Protein-L-isoaspartate O-methyltransferase [Fulvivirga imtechensis AK7]